MPTTTKSLITVLVGNKDIEASTNAQVAVVFEKQQRPRVVRQHVAHVTEVP